MVHILHINWVRLEIPGISGCLPHHPPSTTSLTWPAGASEGDGMGPSLATCVQVTSCASQAAWGDDDGSKWVQLDQGFTSKGVVVVEVSFKRIVKKLASYVLFGIS